MQPGANGVKNFVWSSVLVAPRGSASSLKGTWSPAFQSSLGLEPFFLTSVDDMGRPGWMLIPADSDRLKNSASTDNESCSDFTTVELTRVIRKMRRKGAEGPDDIPPTFLKELGNKSLTELLSIFNISFRQAECHQIWRNAIILPLLKSGKLASELPSYRPISLTSCVLYGPE